MIKRTRKKKFPGFQVIIVVNGGVAEVLSKPRGVAVILYDYDVAGEDESGISKDSDDRRCFIRKWNAYDEIIDDANSSVADKTTSV